MKTYEQAGVDTKGNTSSTRDGPKIFGALSEV